MGEFFSAVPLTVYGISVIYRKHVFQRDDKPYIAVFPIISIKEQETGAKQELYS